MTNLSREETKKIRQVMSDIAELSRAICEPMDPKLEPLLELAHAILNEQIQLDKKYKWGERPTSDDMYLDNSGIPSAEELRKMMEDE